MTKERSHLRNYHLSSVTSLSWSGYHVSRDRNSVGEKTGHHGMHTPTHLGKISIANEMEKLDWVQAPTGAN